MADVLVIGAGVIGCASALALAKRGASVCVVERGAPVAGGPESRPPWGEGASWAAAGVIGAQVEIEEDGPMAQLCLASHARYAAWAGALVEATGIDVGFRPCGVMRVAFDAREAAAIAREAAWQAATKLPVEVLDGAAARALEPSLSDQVTGGVRFGGDGRVDPPALMQALRIAAVEAGARFRGGA